MQPPAHHVLMRLLLTCSMILWCAVIGARLALIDIRTHRLPNRLVLRLGVGLWSGIVVWWLMRRLDVDTGSPPDYVALWFTVVVAVVLAGWSMVTPMSIGMGDAKLVLALAPVFALADVASELAALWLVSLVAVMVIVLRRLIRSVPLGAPLAFGPFLLLAAPVALALGGILA